MRLAHSSRRWRRVLLAFGAAVFLAAQYSDPVEDLRQALPIDDVAQPNDAMLQFRRDNLQKLTARLDNVRQLRRALALDEWRDDPTRVVDERIRRIDAEMRRQVAERLTQIVQKAAQSADPTTRIGAANLLAEIGPSIRSVGDDKGGYARSLAPTVVQLTRDDDVGVRQEALRALGTINATPQTATQVFAAALREDPAVGPRRVAADSLGQLLRVINHLQKRGRTSAGVEATRAETLTALEEVVRTAPIGMRDDDAHVRQSSLEALQVAAQTLADIVPDAFPKKDLPPPGRPLTETETVFLAKRYEEIRRQTEEVKPALSALAAQHQTLARALRDADPSVRYHAAQALLNIAAARQRLRRLAADFPSIPGDGRDPQTLLAQVDPLADFLAKDLGALAPLFRDPDPRLRRAAAYTALLLEEKATPLAEQVIGSLVDPERTVRWASAKTLSTFPPEKTAPAAPYLAKLLSDPDTDTRIAAAQALQGLGAAAEAAIPALAEAALRGDSEARTAALGALIAQGPERAKAAVPLLIEVVNQPDIDATVLVAAAQTLGRIGPPARPAIPALRRLIGHADTEVRTAASEAIIDISRAGP